jgi:dihydroorotate dehydrogenase
VTERVTSGSPILIPLPANFYGLFVRPFLFSLPPEFAHHLALAALAAAGRTPFREFLRSLYEIDNSSLRIDVGPASAALSFPNPVGLAAGFDKNARVLPGLAALGFGFLEAGTVTPKPQSGQPKPRLFRLPKDRALLNRMGFNNIGAIDVAEYLAGRSRPLQNLGEKVRLDRVPVPVGFNIGKGAATPLESAENDYVFCHESLYDWADYYVVNVSSPNTPGLRRLQSAGNLLPLLRGLRQRNDALAARRARRTRPLMFVKVSPDDDPGEELVEVVVKAGLDGVVACNTTLSREGLSSSASGGGISGLPLRDRSTEIIRRLYKAAGGRLAIIGVGGVFTADDAYDKIRAGASLVQVYTGFVYRGWSIARDINVGLLRLLKRDGFRNVREAVGTAS